jgi:DNA helicase-2/ATP-dependent DNA helicase PcrA
VKWSRFQEAVFEDFRSGNGHTAVEAVAGSGKSTVAVECLNHLPQGGSPDVLLTSFSVQSINDLKAKDPPWFVDLRTLNSLGNQALTRSVGPQKLATHRAYSKIDEVLGKNTITDPAAKQQMTSLRVRIKTLTDFAKAALVETTDGLNDLAEGYDLDTNVAPWLGRELKERFGCAPEDAVAHLTSRVLEASKKLDGTVDFNDQLWLPVVLGVDVQKFDRILADEGQDLSRVQIELLCKSMKQDSRVFMWGQSKQAIYHWRGAGLGMEPFIKRLNAKRLPLSISYRCPKAVTRLAQKIVPAMQASPLAIEGLVESLPMDMLSGKLQAGDAVLSRKNAPLIGLFMRLLKDGVPAGIQGRDLGGKLIRFVEDSGAKTAEELLDYTREWAARERARKQKRNPNARMDTIDDHEMCIATLCEDTRLIDVVLQRIKTLLQSDPTNKVVLSSCHRAKGLEWDRVFLLESSFPVCPDYWLTYARKGDANVWAAKKAAEIMETEIEERNIRYVALTRSKRELYLVKDV